MSLAPLRTLRDLILSGGNGPSSTAVVVLDEGKNVLQLSRRELAELVEQMGWELRRLGVRPGNVVSLSMENTVEYVITFFAITWIRAIASPLNPSYKQGEVEFYFKDTSPVLAIVPATGNSEAEKAAKTLGVTLAMTGDLGTCLSQNIQTKPSLSLTLIHGNVNQVESSALWTWDLPQATDVALYLHTSGTTSRPKLVPLSHHNLCKSTGNIRNTYDLDWKDTCYLVMPLFHVHGLVGALFSTLASGGVVALPLAGKFSARSFWVDINACNATWYTAVPTIHQILLKREQEDRAKIAQANLRFIRSCSSPLAPPVFRQLESLFRAPVLEAYAMTESAHQISSNPLPKNGKRKAGTVGRGMNVQVAILDDQNRIVTQPNTVGQICIRGENVTVGYHNQIEANAKEFSHGWFHTGDQGFLDEDGYITITGRLKELINRGGEKIAPVEIDAAILGNKDVSEAVAFGLPDEKYGEQVVVAVVLKNGALVSETEILDHCVKTLSKEKVPSKVFIVEQIPKTATGKVQRRVVAEHFSGSKSKM